MFLDYLQQDDFVGADTKFYKWDIRDRADTLIIKAAENTNTILKRKL